MSTTVQIPSFSAVKLSTCCVDSLQEIKNRLQLSKQLSDLVGHSILASLFNENASSMSFSLSQPEMRKIMDAIGNSSRLHYHSCKMICFDEAQVNHQNGEIHLLWMSLYESFN